MEYPIVIYPSPEGGYVAEVPQLRGCLAQGETEMECLQELEHVMDVWLETARSNNLILPKPGNFLERLRNAVNA